MQPIIQQVLLQVLMQPATRIIGLHLTSISMISLISSLASPHLQISLISSLASPHLQPWRHKEKTIWNQNRFFLASNSWLAKSLVLVGSVACRIESQIKSGSITNELMLGKIHVLVGGGTDRLRIPPKSEFVYRNVLGVGADFGEERVRKQ